MTSSKNWPANYADETPIYSELAIGDVPHLAEHFWLGAKEATPADDINAAIGSLPYAQLGDMGFERLCFHLVLAEGHAPRFWGRRGQAQQGIDLIMSDGGSSTVIQCKNHTRYDVKKLKSALDKFRKEWIEAQPAPAKPKTFILCTSAELKDRAEWEKCKSQFWKEFGVGVEEWPRETLDKKLRRQPGIVADLFGDKVAELFCGRGVDWDLGLFRPLIKGSGDERVDRFLSLRDTGRIVRLASDKSRFDNLLSRHHQLLLGGLAGTGKTMAALDLAMAFEGASWRVFYLRPEDTQSVDQLFDGIRHRAFRNSIFVLDDCQSDFHRVDVLLRRVRTIKDRRIKLVLTARTPPTGTDFLDPAGTSFVQELVDAEQVLHITANADRYRAIVGLRRPGWRDPPIDRLMTLTGHDLAILDLVLDTSALDDFKIPDSLEGLFGSVLHEIFDSNTADAPNLTRLAAISQFDAQVPRTLFPEPFEQKPNENAAAQRFLVVGGRPPTVAFGHPSAAELMFRLLVWSQGEDLNAACVRHCADALEAFQSKLAIRELLPRLLRNRLKLADNRSLKTALLIEKRVVALFERERERVPITLLSPRRFSAASSRHRHPLQLGLPSVW